MQHYLFAIGLLALLSLSACRAFSYLTQGNEHYELGRYAEAVADLETALALVQAAGDDGLGADIEEMLEEAVRYP